MNYVYIDFKIVGFFNEFDIGLWYCEFGFILDFQIMDVCTLRFLHADL